MPQEASKPRVASVRPDSDLPQLDRDFDYSVPEQFQEQIGVGSEVSIRLGKGASPIRGFVRALKSESEFSGKLSPLETCSPLPVVTEPLMQLCELLAQRHACNLAEFLTLAVPVPAVRLSAQILDGIRSGSVSTAQAESERSSQGAEQVGQRTFAAVECSQLGFNRYFTELAKRAGQYASTSRSTLILAADERTQNRIVALLEAQGVKAALYSSTLTRSQRYKIFTDALAGRAQVVVGGRSASLLPLQNLSQVVVWDEGDPNFADRSAPYVTVREICALRQQIEQFDWQLAGFVPSVSAARWLDTKFIRLLGDFTTSTKISFHEAATKFGRQSISAIREALASGTNALVIASTPGFTDAFYCASCNERAACRFCGSSIKASENGNLTCRTCNAPETSLRCRSCGSAEFDSGSGGAARSVQELGKLFPGVGIRESTGASPLSQAPQAAAIVVSTVGVTPEDSKGYGAIVILEAHRFLRREGLYAREEALRQWAQVLGYASPGAKVVFEGVSQVLGQDLALWNQLKLANEQLVERAELLFPPVHRLASVTGSRDNIQNLENSLAGIADVRLLGVTATKENRSQIEDEAKLVISYPHKATVTLAQRLREEQLKLTGAISKNKRTGRAVRPLRINMDDMKVI